MKLEIKRAVVGQQLRFGFLVMKRQTDGSVWSSQSHAAASATTGSVRLSSASDAPPLRFPWRPAVLPGALVLLLFLSVLLWVVLLFMA